MLPRRPHHARRLRLAALAAAPVLALAGCGGGNDTAKDTGASNGTSTGTSTGTSSRTPTDVSCDYTADGQTPSKPVDPPPAKADVSGQLSGTMDTSAGAFHLTLDADAAPCTVNSFVSLADQGYFDSTSCHRLTEAATGIAVLQCGDPTGTGTGGPGYSFADELTGSETYPAGTLAMANAGPDTNGSQFFIVYGATPLPPSYTVFGSVDAATIALVQKVADGGVDNAFGQGDGHPKTEVKITHVSVD